MYVISAYIRLELAGVLLVATGLLSPVEGNLLGVERDVTMLNVDCIIPGWMWGSSSRSFTVAMLEPLWVSHLIMAFHDGLGGLSKWVP